jgi:hypothetical protein
MNDIAILRTQTPVFSKKPGFYDLSAFLPGNELSEEEDRTQATRRRSYSPSAYGFVW